MFVIWQGDGLKLYNIPDDKWDVAYNWCAGLVVNGDIPMAKAQEDLVTHLAVLLGEERVYTKEIPTLAEWSAMQREEERLNLSNEAKFERLTQRSRMGTPEAPWEQYEIELEGHGVVPASHVLISGWLP